jgi:ribosomal protein L31E
VQAGALAPIPFQIDERDSAGQYVLTCGQGASTDEDPLFDANDELVFMAADAGAPAASATPPPNVSHALEIEIADTADGSRGYAYVFAFREPVPETSRRDYVRFDAGSECVHTLYYQVCTSPGSVLYGRQTIEPRAGGDSKDYVDRLKVRVKFKSRLLGIPGHITEENLVARLAGYAEGSVRTIVRRDIYCRLFRGIKIHTEISENVYYRGHYVVPKCFRVPIRPSSVFGSVVIDVFGDFNATMKGNRYTNSNLEESVEIDGTTRGVESEINGQQPASWSVSYGPGGNMIEYTIVDSSLHALGYQIYRDSSEDKDPPESERGCYGCWGHRYDVTDLEKGIYCFRSLFIFPEEGFAVDKIHSYLRMEEVPLRVTVKPFKCGTDHTTTKNSESKRATERARITESS